jgi:hypothetical protein
MNDAAGSEVPEPTDPHAEKARDELARLAKSGLGVWRYRVQLCKKRAIAVYNRLKKLDASLQAKEQQRQRKARLQGNSAHSRARSEAAPTAEPETPAGAEPPVEAARESAAPSMRSEANLARPVVLFMKY